MNEENINKFEFCQEPFEPVFLKEALSESQERIRLLSEQKLNIQSQEKSHARALVEKYFDHFKSAYIDAITKTYTGTKMGQKRLERIIAVDDVMKSELTERVYLDLKVNNLKNFPRGSSGPIIEVG